MVCLIHSLTNLFKIIYYFFPRQDIANRKTVVPWYLQGIGSRTHHGHQNLWMLKSQSQFLQPPICILKIHWPRMVWRANTLEKILMLGKIEGKRRRGQQRMRWLDNITDSMDMNLSKIREIGEDRGAWHAAIHAVTKSWTRLSNWTYVCKLTEPQLKKQ